MGVGSEMCRGSNAVGFSDEDSAPGNPGGNDPGDRLHPEADCSGPLRSGPDHEARLIDQIDHGQMELIAEVNEATDFEGAFCIHRAGVKVRVIRDDADGVSSHSRESGNLTPAISPGHLEEALLIENRL